MIKTEVGDNYFYYTQQLKDREEQTELTRRLPLELMQRCCLMPRYPEIYLRRVLERFQPKVVLEIGTYFGVSAAFFSLWPSVKVVYTVDIERYEQTDDVWSLLPKVARDKIKYRVVPDDEAKARAIAGIGYDLVFIDGLHTYDGVKFDFEAVNHDAVPVLFHDYGTNEGVTDFINEIGCEWQSIELSFALWSNE